MGEHCTCNAPQYFCFACRVSVKRRHGDPPAGCHLCGQPMTHFGKGDVKTPKKSDRKGWASLRQRYVRARQSQLSAERPGCPEVTCG